MKRTLALVSLLLLASLLAIAADLSGTWNLQGTVSGAPQQLVFTLSNGAVVSGTIDGAPISGGGYSITEFWFKAIRGGTNFQYKGSFNGSTLVLYESAGGPRKTYNYARAGG
jgi:hypothetical protein